MLKRRSLYLLTVDLARRAALADAENAPLRLVVLFRFVQANCETLGV
jgi:hypothetical protein